MMAPRLASAIPRQFSVNAPCGMIAGRTKEMRNDVQYR